jgi:hypothetical protein
MVIYDVEYFVESQIATCSLQLTCFFWSQVTHVWALHPNVHFLSLLFTFDFHILLVYNIPILWGYWYYSLLQVSGEKLWNSCEQTSLKLQGTIKYPKRIGTLEQLAKIERETKPKG